MSTRPDDFGHGGRRSRGPWDPQLRIGDAERNEVADALSQHFAAGRLDQTELRERLDRATAAKTGADLGGLLSDLPPLPSASAPAPGPPVPVRRGRRSALWVAAAVVLVAMTAPWYAAPWLWFPRIPWLVIGLVCLALWRRSHRRRFLRPPY
ncbi:MAG: DUF1707 SHOCT-like domain-containing protein [Acidimicrobiales bacterium]